MEDDVQTRRTPQLEALVDSKEVFMAGKKVLENITEQASDQLKKYKSSLDEKPMFSKYFFEKLEKKYGILNGLDDYIKRFSNDSDISPSLISYYLEGTYMPKGENSILKIVNALKDQGVTKEMIIAYLPIGTDKMPRWIHKSEETMSAYQLMMAKFGRNPNLPLISYVKKLSRMTQISEEYLVLFLMKGVKLNPKQRISITNILGPMDYNHLKKQGLYK